MIRRTVACALLAFFAVGGAPAEESKPAKEEPPSDFRRHMLKMASVGTYIVLPPPDYGTSGRSYPVCLILHGMGSSEVAHGKLADAVGREGVLFVAPRWPYPSGRGWSARPGDERAAAAQEAHELCNDWILACVEDVRKRYRVAGERIFILGHSQGAFAAHAIACLHPEKVASYFAYAGFLPETYRDRLAGLKAKGVKVVQAHGTEDRVVPPDRARRAHEWMKEAGVDCQLKLFEAEHGFTPEVSGAVREWLDAEARPPAAK